MAPRTALIVGASGLVGGHCLDVLLADAAYANVTALGRRLVARTDAKLRQHVIDFTRPAGFGKLMAADDVFCCLGTTIRTAGSPDAFRRVDFGVPVAVAEAAVGQGARQFLVVSAVGASTRAPAFYSRVKGEMEETVARLPFRGVHIFRPSLLLGHREEFRPAERVAILALAPISLALVGPLRRYRPIAASTVAAGMVETAKRDAAGVHVHEFDSITAAAARRLEGS